MINRKIAMSVTLIGLFAANVALAVPGFTTEASQSSVDTCITQVDGNADYEAAASVIHNVETSDRRVSGHKMRIRTMVYAEDGETVIREYFTSCAINGQDEIQRFKIRQKGRI